MPTITRQQLLDLLDTRLDKAELRELAYDVGLDLDNLEGDTKREDLMSLLRYHDQRQTLNTLVANLAHRRPDLGLADTTVEPMPPPSTPVVPVAAPPPPSAVSFVSPTTSPPLATDAPASITPATITPAGDPKQSWKSNPWLVRLGYGAAITLAAVALFFLAISVSSDPTFDATTRVIGLVVTLIPAWLAFKLWQVLRS